MSDIKPESGKDTTNLPDPNFIVKHSGEEVVHELNTPLEQAPVHPIPDTVDEFLTLEPTLPRQNKWLKPFAGFIAAVAIGGGAYVMGSNSGEERPDITPTTEEPAVNTDRGSVESTSTTTSSTTQPELEPSADAVTVIRLAELGEEQISIDLLSDQDIRSGKAVEILKEISSLYITTGDERLLDNFVDRTKAANAIQGWKNIRNELDMENETKLFKDTAFRFDVRDLDVEDVSMEANSAKILISGGNDMYLQVAPDWETFDFESAKELTVRHESPNQMYGYFEFSDSRWRFVGWEFVENS